uniref:Uncharacterized protein n=1 Tax=Anguilla anguilla TaxID=7936 RepID=A0A0E9TUB7_ANGAN
MENALIQYLNTCCFNTECPKHTAKLLTQ